VHRGHNGPYRVRMEAWRCGCSWGVESEREKTTRCLTADGLLMEVLSEGTIPQDLCAYYAPLEDQRLVSSYFEAPESAPASAH
jgi:hypothetical protein